MGQGQRTGPSLQCGCKSDPLPRTWPGLLMSWAVRGRKGRCTWLATANGNWLTLEIGTGVTSLCLENSSHCPIYLKTHPC